MPPRVSLSSIVCPVTPFLLPPSARIALWRTLQCAQSQIHSNQYASYGTASKKGSQQTSKWLTRIKRQQHAALKRDKPVLDAPGPLQNFRILVDSEDIVKAMELYPQLVSNKLLTPIDTLAVAKLLHTALRTRPNRIKYAELLSPYVDQLAHDIQKKLLPPLCAAHVHILSFYKTAKKGEQGHKFWEFLSSQDERYVDPAVYGAAIEMLAFEGTTNLKELEELYNQALKRFPTGFAEYHLSPEAVTLDKSQHTSIVGLSMTLLQGILTARLLHGDWRKAYLAFDTVLRLYPTQVPQRFFELFVYERPVGEGYTAFLIACRAGNVVKPDLLTVLMRRLAEEMPHHSMGDRLLSLRGMITAMYAYIGSGGELQSHHLSSLINGFTACTPDRLPNTKYEGDEAKIRDLIVSMAQQTAVLLVQAGAQPTLSVFGALITLGGKAMRPEVIAQALKDMEAAELEANAVIHRTLVTAAGRLGQPEEVELRWRNLVEAAEEEGRQLTYREWIVLARAAVRANDQPFLHQEFQRLSHAITPHIQRSVMDRSNQQENTPKIDIALDPNAVALQIRTVWSQILQLAELLKSDKLLDFYQTPISMLLDPAAIALGSVEDLRAIYDELTNDSMQQLLQEQDGSNEGDNSSVKKAVSPTGLPLDELRFENWVSIMELLDEAEANEALKNRRVDEAIASGKAVSTEAMPLTSRRLSAPDELAKPPTRDGLRQKILRLRGLAAV